jgi:LacI family repressor for deo operon, udp, cdd, tsx, nupC, and nupG
MNRPERVRPETRRRVETAIKALNYQPNLVARSLRRRHTKTLGVVVADIDDPFFTKIVRAVQDTCGESAYQVIVCNTDEDIEKEKAAVQTLFGTHVDGIILAPTFGDHRYLVNYVRQALPIVTINRRIRTPRLPCVISDNETGCRMGMEHLIKLGHRRIGIITGFSKTSTTTDRLRGYRRVLSAHNIPYDARLVRCGHLRVEGGYEAVKEFLGLVPPPTAIFALNNAMAEGAFVALRDLRVRCPEDVALIGYDDFRAACALQPPLTVVAQPTRAIGLQATQLILRIIESGRQGKRSLILPPHFIHRGSCGCAVTTGVPTQVG